jgi:hypothetical protein
MDSDSLPVLAMVTGTASAIAKAILFAPGPVAVEATLAAMVVYSEGGAATATLAVIAPIPLIGTMKAKALAAGAVKVNQAL